MILWQWIKIESKYLIIWPYLIFNINFKINAALYEYLNIYFLKLSIDFNFNFQINRHYLFNSKLSLVGKYKIKMGNHQHTHNNSH
jgi:hypothetical protein